MDLPDFVVTEVEAALADLDPRSQVRGRHILERLAHRAYTCGRDAAIAELLTSEQVAPLVGLSQSQLRSVARRRNVGWLVGRDRLYRPEDLERLRDRRQRGRPRAQ
ncbi:MAG: hypothetical protein AB7R89_16080 [Dehalococcoidia bacterium]